MVVEQVWYVEQGQKVVPLEEDDSDHCTNMIEVEEVWFP